MRLIGSLELLACLMAFSATALAVGRGPGDGNPGQYYAFQMNGAVLPIAHLNTVYRRDDANSNATAQVSFDFAFDGEWSNDLVTWLNGAMHGSGVEPAAEILTADFNLNVVGQLGLSQAHITSITFPTWDGGAKDTADISVGVSSAYMENAGGGAKLNFGPGGAAGKSAQAANFSVTIGSLPTDKISKVEISPWSADGGEMFVTFTLSELDSQPFIDWFNGTDDPRDAQVNQLSRDMKSTLASLQLQGLVPVEVDHVTSDEGTRILLKCRIDSITLATAGSGFAKVDPSRMLQKSYLVKDVGAISVDKVAYDATRFTVADDDPVVPTADEKLVIMHVRVSNAGQAPYTLDGSTFSARFTDKDGNVVDSNGRFYDEKTHAVYSRTLAHGATGHIVLVASVPADAVEKTLELRGNTDISLGMVYDLTAAGNVPEKLPGGFAKPNDTSGAVAASTMMGKPRESYPLGAFDVALINVTHVEQFGDGPAWVASFRVTNRSMRDASLNQGTFHVSMSMEGAEDEDASDVYGESSSEPLSTNVRPGAEVVVRYPFVTDAKGSPAEITIQEGDSRRFVFQHPA